VVQSKITRLGVGYASFSFLRTKRQLDNISIFLPIQPGHYLSFPRLVYYLVGHHQRKV
jgi:hypothetical protein